MFDFEELDYQKTPHGEISLRRRAEPRLQGKIVYEVKLGDEFLMSSLFTESEIQLARLALAGLEGDNLDILVGGLGLGYTAMAVLESSAVESLTVVEVMAPVIDWHRRGLVPLGEPLVADPRSRLLHADFFALAMAPGNSFFEQQPQRQVDAVLLDIDHSPSHWLNPSNSGFYTEEGLRSLSRKIRPGGLFGLWSNEPPSEPFMRMLESQFASAWPHVVSFPNPYQGGESACTVYLARNAPTAQPG